MKCQRGKETTNIQKQIQRIIFAFNINKEDEGQLILQRTS
jgi:hypothetical protein